MRMEMTIACVGRVAGIISARNNYKRRQAVRDAWADASQVCTMWLGPQHSSLSGLWRSHSGRVKLISAQPQTLSETGSIKHSKSAGCSKYAPAQQGACWLRQVPGVSMTRFFVPSRGVTHQWTVKEMASHDDFVFLDMSATYQTIGSQVVRRCIPELSAAAALD